MVDYPERNPGAEYFLSKLYVSMLTVPLKLVFSPLNIFWSYDGIIQKVVGESWKAALDCVQLFMCSCYNVLDDFSVLRCDIF